MKHSTKILGGAALVVVLAVITMFSWGVGSNNSWVRMENTIKAQYKQNQNNYDNYFKKLKEMVQVPDMYAAALKDVYTSALKARNGADGSRAVISFLKEHNPNFDSSMYTKVMQTIEAGRNSFEADQKRLLDLKREYETSLQVFPDSTLASTLGFPKIDLAVFDIVTSEQTEEAFKTKKAAPIKLRD